MTGVSFAKIYVSVFHCISNLGQPIGLQDAVSHTKGLYK